MGIAQTISAVTVGVIAFAGLAACKSRPTGGCERLYEQRKRCEAVYQPRKKFVHRCRQARKRSQAAHLREQIRCAEKADCATYRTCVKAARQARLPPHPRGMAPALYRSLRPTPSPPGTRR